ncbi:hypothetical protein [Micromonospora aurantiaca (nom. illeg.)]|uniref:hypothetical protein n=1 Tax=Micromonospora aurantiaca (nom. illeg.) TaxID=47850 RepID=UPI0033F5A7C6
MRITAEDAAKEIRRAYNVAATQHGGRDWTAIARLAERVDLTPAEMAEGIRHLARTDRRVVIAPESNQKAITPVGHLYAVRYGGQDNHLITWW